MSNLQNRGQVGPDLSIGSVFLEGNVSIHVQNLSFIFAPIHSLLGIYIQDRTMNLYEECAGRMLTIALFIKTGNYQLSSISARGKSIARMACYVHKLTDEGCASRCHDEMPLHTCEVINFEGWGGGGETEDIGILRYCWRECKMGWPCRKESGGSSPR